MRVVVAGATGLIGSRTVARLRDHGVQVVRASRREGVDVMTGKGLTEVMRGADVVADVTDTPSRGGPENLEFFGTATRNLLAAAAKAGAEHHVILSIVEADRLRAGYFRAKAQQEEQVRRSSMPCSIVRTTPCFESVEYMSRWATCGGAVHVAPVLIRPVSADDVAAEIAHVAVGVPLFGAPEVAGPQEHRLDDLTSKLLAARGYLWDVVSDAHTPFFGARLGQRALLPGADARLGHETFSEWLARR
jgi:uncharacterized protein YbjT (DUF2867 family)